MIVLFKHGFYNHLFDWEENRRRWVLPFARHWEQQRRSWRGHSRASTVFGYAQTAASILNAEIGLTGWGWFSSHQVEVYSARWWRIWSSAEFLGNLRYTQRISISRIHYSLYSLFNSPNGIAKSNQGQLGSMREAFHDYLYLAPQTSCRLKMALHDHSPMKKNLRHSGLPCTGKNLSEHTLTQE